MKYGRYEIEKELGKGAMGVVYQAHDPNINRRVALKVLRSDRVTSEDFAQRFLQEARAIGRLSHPNIVTVFDVGNDHGTVYIAMEFLNGRPLDELIRERSFDVKEIIAIGSQVAASLDYAHGQGIVHRDIKPSNIMLTSDGSIKLTDFGIARIEDPNAAQLTQAGEILGTPSYMSPEQVKGQPVDGRSDLFSLGVILYEISTGRRPFSGKSLAAIFNAISNEQPEEPMAFEPFISRGGDSALSELIMKSLSKSPENRFQNGKSMADRLATCLDKSQENATTEIPDKKSKPKIGWYAAVATGLIILISVFFWIHSIQKETDPSPKTATQPTSTPTDIPKPVILSLLNITSNPANAQVFIDGSFKGNTPLKLDLPTGKYEVRVSLTDYYEYEAQIQLKDPGEFPLFVRLASMK